MQTRSRGALWTGRVLSTVAVLFLTFDSIAKLLEVQPVLDGAMQLGYPVSTMFGIGVILLLCVVTYVVPATAVFGAVLLTGYLGGAVATHVRVGSPVPTHILFPIYVAALVWSGLLLRDPRLRAFIPLRARTDRRIQMAGHEHTMAQVISRDGTPIAYERAGSGPALIIVDGALCSRAFGPSPKLAPLLAPHFTVYTYDRRGRGDSGDMQTYARDREIDDVAALIQAAGESAALLGLSSGAALALEAAARGLPVTKVVAYEPPYVHEAGAPPADHERELHRLLGRNDRGGMVKYFMGSMVGAPGFVVVMMQLMPWVWRRLKAVAHTLPYDAAVMDGFRVPASRFSTIGVPALVMHGSKTDARLQHAARTVAGAIPGARHATLAGQTHNVSPAALVPPVVQFVKA